MCTFSFVKYTLVCNTQNSALNLTCEMPLNPKSLLPWIDLWGISTLPGELHWCTEYNFLFSSSSSSLWILYECPDLLMRCGQHLGGGDGRVQVFHGAAVSLQHVTVQWRCDKSWVRIPMHKGINLKLCFVESLLRRRHHILIYNLSHPTVEAHLSRWQDGNVVFIDHPRLLLHLLRTRLLLQVLAGDPKENVLLTIFTTQELSKHPTAA